ncbi:MAG: Gfo/Idh/MocA family oxidoreductase [Opitutaceae bacterium]|nr:Gfo/Idh/MocA family oxidoreductase [Opitutaceae bacterium]
MQEDISTISPTISRRQFLRTTASAAATFTIVPRHVLGGTGFVPPSERVNVALVGAGGKGLENMRSLFQVPGVQVTALADPFEETDLRAMYYRRLAGRNPGRAMMEEHYQAKNSKYRCAVYEDFRVMLEKEKDIDAILCATPDHLHGYVSIVAMKAGKHVYCEKPLGHNLWEVQQMARVAKETGVATQMGNQGHSREGLRQTIEWLRDGVIGTVREVHVWSYFSRWNPTLTTRPEGSMTVPKGANWDLWLGPRKERAYNSAYAPVKWRDFWDFGGGPFADFGCHDFDSSLWGLNLGTPSCVEAFPAGITDEYIVPYGSIIYYDFPARTGNSFCDAPVRITWYNGGLKPPTPKEFGAKLNLPERGVLFIGDKGKLLEEATGGPPRLLPYEATRRYQKPAPTLPRSKGHHYDWIAACKRGEPASSNFEYGARLTELILLGSLAQRTRKRIYWDAENMKASGVPEADAIIREDYRKGWEIV